MSDVSLIDADGTVRFQGTMSGVIPVLWTIDQSTGALEVADDSEFATVYFRLTPADDKTFTRHLIAFSSFLLDDAPMTAKNDNGDTFFELDPAGDGGDGTAELGGVDVATKLAQVTALATAITAATASTRISLTEGGIGFFGATPVGAQIVPPIPDPPTVTTQDVAETLNLLIAALGGTAGLGLLDDS